MPIRVLVVDDHSVVRQGLRMFLALDSEIEIIGEAADGAEALRQVEQLKPDVVLMDLLMPVMDGISATIKIRQTFPETEVIAMTSVLEDRAILEAVKAGAIGYLLKDTEADQLSRAIKAAMTGQIQLSPQVSARLIKEMQPTAVVDPLTDRELEVLGLVAAGLSNKEIAGQLTIGEKTVKTHVSNILSKLGLLSRTQAALYAVRMGLVTE